MIAANLRPKEYWIKAALIFVIFSDSNKQQMLPARMIQKPKTSWNHCLRKVDKLSTPRWANGGRGVIPFCIF
jgi:hypothetical protein